MCINKIDWTGVFNLFLLVFLFSCSEKKADRFQKPVSINQMFY